MEESSVQVTTATGLRIAAESSPTMLRSTMSTPDLPPSDSSDDCETPECKCAICLGRLRNKSLIDSCFHEFCFECLVEWSKVKAECPLCKTKFDYIIHNVKSNDDYEKYHLQSTIQHERLQPLAWSPDFPLYRRDVVPHLGAESAIQHFATLPERIPAGRTRRWPRRVQDSTDFRRRVYRCNLWVQPLCDLTNRFRESSPSFYRDNPAQVYRLVRWLQRELRVLLPCRSGQRTIVMHAIVNSIFRYPVRSSTLARELQPYLGSNTRHFIHEFAEFARSPFDMGGHDRTATYLPHRPSTVEEVVLNSPTSSDFSEDNFDDLLNSSGSDIEIIESNVPPPIPVAGPSGIMRSRAPRIKLNLLSNPILPLSNEETHEIISSSSSDECEVIGTFKPPEPEVIDILSDDDEIQPNRSATVAETVDLRTPHTHSERLVSLNEETETPRSDRTPGVTSPGSLDVSSDRPPLVLKIECGRIKPHRAKRRRHSSTRDSNSSWGSSSSSSDREDHRARSKKKKWRWSDSDSDYIPEEEKRGRIPSVVVPQPSFKVEVNPSSSRREVRENDDSGSDNNVKREVRDHKEKSRKKKKSKHTKKHKRSHRAVEDEDWGEGTSESGSSRRCKTCRHRHCHCNRGASSQSSYKRIKNNHRDTTTEERESASGSSRSRSKAKRHLKLKYSDSKCSDSSG